MFKVNNKVTRTTLMVKNIVQKKKKIKRKYNSQKIRNNDGVYVLYPTKVYLLKNKTEFDDIGYLFITCVTRNLSHIIYQLSSTQTMLLKAT